MLLVTVYITYSSKMIDPCCSTAKNIKNNNLGCPVFILVFKILLKTLFRALGYCIKSRVLVLFAAQQHVVLLLYGRMQFNIHYKFSVNLKTIPHMIYWLIQRNKHSNSKSLEFKTYGAKYPHTVNTVEEVQLFPPVTQRAQGNVAGILARLRSFLSLFVFCQFACVWLKTGSNQNMCEKTTTLVTTGSRVKSHGVLWCVCTSKFPNETVARNDKHSIYCASIQSALLRLALWKHLKNIDITVHG